VGPLHLVLRGRRRRLAHPPDETGPTHAHDRYGGPAQCSLYDTDDEDWTPYAIPQPDFEQAWHAQADS
jgi:hypothetical protein